MSARSSGHAAPPGLLLAHHPIAGQGYVHSCAAPAPAKGLESAALFVTVSSDGSVVPWRVPSVTEMHEQAQQEELDNSL